MTIVMKMCRTFGCDRGVTHLRWALGYRTCGRHGHEASGGTRRAAGGTTALPMGEVNTPRVAESGEPRPYSQRGADSECSQAA